MSFYGSLKATPATQLSLFIDKVYPTRTAMDAACAEGDGIFVGRYVMVCYGDTPDLEANENIDTNTFQNTYNNTIWMKQYIVADNGGSEQYIQVGSLEAGRFEVSGKSTLLPYEDPRVTKLSKSAIEINMPKTWQYINSHIDVGKKLMDLNWRSSVSASVVDHWSTENNDAYLDNYMNQPISSPQAVNERVNPNEMKIVTLEAAGQKQLVGNLRALGKAINDAYDIIYGYEHTASTADGVIFKSGDRNTISFEEALAIEKPGSFNKNFQSLLGIYNIIKDAAENGTDYQDPVTHAYIRGQTLKDLTDLGVAKIFIKGLMNDKGGIVFQQAETAGNKLRSVLLKVLDQVIGLADGADWMNSTNLPLESQQPVPEGALIEPLNSKIVEDFKNSSQLISYVNSEEGQEKSVYNLYTLTAIAKYVLSQTTEILATVANPQHIKAVRFNDPDGGAIATLTSEEKNKWANNLDFHIYIADNDLDPWFNYASGGLIVTAKIGEIQKVFGMLKPGTHSINGVNYDNFFDTDGNLRTHYNTRTKEGWMLYKEYGSLSTAAATVKNAFTSTWETLQAKVNAINTADIESTSYITLQNNFKAAVIAFCDEMNRIKDNASSQIGKFETIDFDQLNSVTNCRFSDLGENDDIRKDEEGQSSFIKRWTAQLAAKYETNIKAIYDPNLHTGNSEIDGMSWLSSDDIATINKNTGTIFTVYLIYATDGGKLVETKTIRLADIPYYLYVFDSGATATSKWTVTSASATKAELEAVFSTTWATIPDESDELYARYLDSKAQLEAQLELIGDSDVYSYNDLSEIRSLEVGDVRRENGVVAALTPEKNVASLARNKYLYILSNQEITSMERTWWQDGLKSQVLAVLAVPQGSAASEEELFTGTFERIPNAVFKYTLDANTTYTYPYMYKSHWTDPIDRATTSTLELKSPYDPEPKTTDDITLTLSNFIGARDIGSSGGAKDGEKGLVPKPVIGDQYAYLRGDGTWSHIKADRGLTAELVDNELTIRHQNSNDGLVGLYEPQVTISSKYAPIVTTATNEEEESGSTTTSTTTVETIATTYSKYVKESTTTISKRFDTITNDVITNTAIPVASEHIYTSTTANFADGTVTEDSRYPADEKAAVSQRDIQAVLDYFDKLVPSHIVDDNGAVHDITYDLIKTEQTVRTWDNNYLDDYHPNESVATQYKLVKIETVTTTAGAVTSTTQGLSIGANTDEDGNEVPVQTTEISLNSQLTIPYFSVDPYGHITDAGTTAFTFLDKSGFSSVIDKNGYYLQYNYKSGRDETLFDIKPFVGVSKTITEDESSGEPKEVAISGLPGLVPAPGVDLKKSIAYKNLLAYEGQEIVNEARTYMAQIIVNRLALNYIQSDDSTAYLAYVNNYSSDTAAEAVNINYYNVFQEELVAKVNNRLQALSFSDALTTKLAKTQAAHIDYSTGQAVSWLGDTYEDYDVLSATSFDDVINLLDLTGELAGDDEDRQKLYVQTCVNDAVVSYDTTKMWSDLWIQAYNKNNVINFLNQDYNALFNKLGEEMFKIQEISNSILDKMNDYYAVLFGNGTWGPAGYEYENLIIRTDTDNWQVSENNQKIQVIKLPGIKERFLTFAELNMSGITKTQNDYDKILNAWGQIDRIYVEDDKLTIVCLVDGNLPDVEIPINLKVVIC